MTLRCCLKVFSASADSPEENKHICRYVMGVRLNTKNRSDMKIIRIILFILAIISLISGYLLHPEEFIDERKFLKEIAPDIIFAEKGGAPPHYFSVEGVTAFNTYDITPSIRGYAGPIKILLSLNREGKITGIKIIGHSETKNYVHYMESPQYLNRFIGKSISDPFEIDKDIDGISRATVSVEALAKSIKNSSRIIALNVYGLTAGAEETAVTTDINWLWYLLLFLASLTSYFAAQRSKKFLKARDITLLAGIIIIGLYLSSPFSILHVFNLVLLRHSSAIIWYVTAGSTILSIIIAGRFYCGWLCPFGALCEFAGRLPFKKWDVPKETDEKWRRLKYVLLGVIIVIVLISKRIDYGNYETYVTLFSFSGNVFTWSLVVVSLAANLKVERFWCRYLCPVAAFTGIFSRKAEGYPSRNDCPMGNKPSPHISECIRCNRCYIRQ